MKKLVVFSCAQIFLFNVYCQVNGKASSNNLLTGFISESGKEYNIPALSKPGAENSRYWTVVITTSGTTTTLGCNPTAAEINAALGSAFVSTDCAPGTLTVADQAVVITGCSYSQTRTWTATDNCGGTATASRTVTWTVNNNQPIASISFTTNDPGCNPTAQELNDALGTAVLNAGCGSATLTVEDGPVQSSGCSRTQTRTWTATDDCNHFMTAQRTLTWIEDNIAPVITTSGPGTALGCNPSSSAIDAALGTAFITDNCGPQSVSQIIGPVVSSGCNRSKTVTWTATDGCGHTTIASRTATWTEDVTPPVFDPVANITQSPDPGMSTAVVNIITPTITDNCGGGLIIGGRSDNHLLNDPYPLGQTTITWRATDACGNMSTIAQTVTIADTQLPVITYCPVIPSQCFKENGAYSIPVLTASDNWGIDLISYEITGATSRKGVGNDASGLFNPGTNIIHWTVTDLAGNSASCATSVVIDKVDAVIPDAWAANITAAIGSPNTIYIGYGGTSLTLTAEVTSSVSPNSFSYKWTTGSPGGTIIGTGPSITVSPATNTTYYLSIKDANLCKPLAQVTKQVNVTDIRCGNGKVWICEMQKNGTFKSVCISSTKVADISPGSYLGQCPTAVTRAPGVQENAEQKNIFHIVALPNPSTGSFELRISTANEQKPVIVRTTDMTGRVIDVKETRAGQVLRLGAAYTPGIFIIEASQGDQRAIIKVVKM
jgi:hypothetical protein